MTCVSQSYSWKEVVTILIESTSVVASVSAVISCVFSSVAVVLAHPAKIIDVIKQQIPSILFFIFSSHSEAFFLSFFSKLTLPLRKIIKIKMRIIRKLIVRYY